MTLALVTVATADGGQLSPRGFAGELILPETERAAEMFDAAGLGTPGRKFGDVFSFVPDLLTDESVGYLLSPCRAGDMTLSLYPPAFGHRNPE